MLGDCMEMMKDIPDGSVDMILTDPPYSSGGLFIGERQKKTKEKYTDTQYKGAARFPDFSGDNMDQRSFTEFMRMVFMNARRKTKPEAVLCTFVDWRNLPAMTDAIQAAGWIWCGIVVWNKKNSRNIPGRFRPDCEYIIWGTNGKKKVDWTPGFHTLPGCYNIPSVNTKQKEHQTQKPLELLENLLKISPDHAIILDPFMGSGSTGVACVHTGRDFIGIELSEEYFVTAERKIREAEQPERN